MNYPKCAIGTWGWGSGINGGNMVFGKTPTEEQLSAVYDTALKNGLTLFDTAPVYGGGSSEKIVGNLIKNNPDVIISTKFAPSKSDTPESVGKSLTKSLSRLNRDYADVMWLHTPDNIEVNMNAMALLAKAGKIKNIGISNANINEIKLAQKVLAGQGLQLYGVQNHYSLLYRFSEKTGLLDYCNENNITFYAYMILEQGALTGAKKLPALSRRGMAFTKSRIEKLSVLTDKMSELAQKYNTDIAGIAVAHARFKEMTPIIGVTDAKHTESLAKSLNVNISDDEAKILEKLADETGVSVKAAWEKALA